MKSQTKELLSPKGFWRIVMFACRTLKVDKHLSDKSYLNLLWKCQTGKSMNWDNPQTYNEKMQWMKVYYHRPDLTRLVDKYEAKLYTDKILGPGHTFPLLGVWDKPEDIDFNTLPNEFVLKCTHNSAEGMAFCKDKEKGIYTGAHGKDKTILTKEQVINGLRKAMKESYYLKSREWPYKNVKPRIIAEKLMKSDDGDVLKDYKFFCFDGEPKFVWVGSNFDPMWFNVMTADWKNLHCKWGYYDLGPENIAPPTQLKEMLEVAKKLSKGLPHVRIDLYSINNIIYLGEYTFFTHGGLAEFEPESFNKFFGDCIKLPKPIQ